MTPDEVIAAADDAGPWPIGRPRQAPGHDESHARIAAARRADAGNAVWLLRSHLDAYHGEPWWDVVRANVDDLVARHDALHPDGS